MLLPLETGRWGVIHPVQLPLGLIVDSIRLKDPQSQFRPSLSLSGRESQVELREHIDSLATGKSGH